MFLFQSRDRVVRQKLPWRNTFSNARAIGRTRKFSIDASVASKLVLGGWKCQLPHKNLQLFVGIKIYYRSKKNRSTSAVVRLCGKYVVLSGKERNSVLKRSEYSGTKKNRKSPVLAQNPIQITRFRADPAPIVAIERERIVDQYTVRR